MAVHLLWHTQSMYTRVLTIERGSEVAAIVEMWIRGIPRLLFCRGEWRWRDSKAIARPFRRAKATLYHFPLSLHHAFSNHERAPGCERRYAVESTERCAILTDLCSKSRTARRNSPSPKITRSSFSRSKANLHLALDQSRQSIQDMCWSRSW